MKFLIWIAVLLPLFFTACSDDDETMSRSLEKEGMLGEWVLLNAYHYEVGSTVIIDDLAVDLGELSFAQDDETEDLVGLFAKSEIGGEVTGIFTLNPLDSTLLFVFDGKELLYDYDLSLGFLEISQQDGTTIFVESYQKK